MNKFWKYVQYGYVVVAVVLLIDAILNWNTNRGQSYFSIGFAIFMLLVFLFKRNFRRKLEQRNKQR
ncbi:hypothetical protein [Tenacibaculum geojense]|uniref:Uncharacterized protein n=1 Tax=Tenacibaculum geojense TaxID=915352 RepID=A0ABW3JRZ8_9FLAO